MGGAEVSGCNIKLLLCYNKSNSNITFEINSNFRLIFRSKSNFSRQVFFMKLLFLGFGGHLCFCGVSDDTVLDL